VNERNGRSVVVRVNDRGPFIGRRVIDLAKGPAQALGMTSSGTAYVSLHRLD
jgi:rare lipoprotein A